MKKIAILLTLSLLLTLGSTIAASAYVVTNQQWYIITEANGNGPTVNLTAANKEYRQIAVNVSDTSKSVTVQFYKSTNLGLTHEWYGNDQIISYGLDRRVWWVGDSTGNRNYFIHAQTDANEMTLSGWLENFQ